MFNEHSNEEVPDVFVFLEASFPNKNKTALLLLEK